MMMLDIAICDDDITDLKTISKIVSGICVDEAIDYNISIYSSGKEMLDQTYNIDIGILDISMRELNGIDLGMELKKKFPDVQLIYTTSYDLYCQQVINKVHAFSFLTKPVTYENVKEQIIELLDNMEEDPTGRKHEFYDVTTSDKRKIEVLRLSLKDIIYFEYIKTARRIRIVCKDNCYEFVYVINKLTEELREFGFEVNCRGMLVNMRHIRKVKGYLIHMDNGQELALSQKRKADFVKRLNIFMHDNIN